MEPFVHIKHCLELSERDLQMGVSSRGFASDLLRRLADISRPRDGGPKVLLLFARMATSACQWLDGDLRVELAAYEDMTLVHALSELSGGLNERALPSITMMVPLLEFARAIERAPHAISPLAMRTRDSKRIVLTATADMRRSSLPPPVSISQESLFQYTLPPSAYSSMMPMAGTEDLVSKMQSQEPEPIPLSRPPSRSPSFNSESEGPKSRRKMDESVSLVLNELKMDAYFEADIVSKPEDDET